MPIRRAMMSTSIRSSIRSTFPLWYHFLWQWWDSNDVIYHCVELKLLPSWVFATGMTIGQGFYSYLDKSVRGYCIACGKALDRFNACMASDHRVDIVVLSLFDSISQANWKNPDRYLCNETWLIENQGMWNSKSTPVQMRRLATYLDEMCTSTEIKMSRSEMMHAKLLIWKLIFVKFSRDLSELGRSFTTFSLSPNFTTLV